MKCCVFLAVLLMAVARSSFGQALPAAEASPISTGFELPTIAGTLNYAVSVGETLNWGYYTGSGSVEGTNLSGDLGYISNSKRDPFSMVLAGGHSWGTSGFSYSFVSLGLSQQISVGRWTYVLSDSLAYLPGTPTTGLTGLPGVGDLGINPVQVGPPEGQGILTDYSNRISNTASLSIQRPITGKTSFNASGSYSINRFLSTSSGNSVANSGLDSDSESGGGGINHEINARTSWGANYAYSAFNYPGNTFGLAVESFDSQTASVRFTYHFTRKLFLTAAAGPQWTSINNGSLDQCVRGRPVVLHSKTLHDGAHLRSYYKRRIWCPWRVALRQRPVFDSTHLRPRLELCLYLFLYPQFESDGRVERAADLRLNACRDPGFAGLCPQSLGLRQLYFRESVEPGFRYLGRRCVQRIFAGARLRADLRSHVDAPRTPVRRIPCLVIER